MKKLGKTMVIAALTGSLVVMPVSAAPDVDALKKEKAETQQAINNTNSQLSQLLTEFAILKGDIRKQEAAIQKADEDLKVAQKKEQKQYEEMVIRIKYMYEKGEGSEIAALLGAGSFGELLNQAEYIQNVHTYDRERLEEFAKVKKEVVDLKSGLEAEKKEMEALADVYSSEEKSLKSTLSVMRTQMANFDVQLAEAQRQAEEEAKRIEEEAKRVEQEQQAQQAQQSQNHSGGSGESSKPDSKPSGNKPSKPSESKPDKPSHNENNSNQNKPTENKPSENKPSNNKPAESKPDKPSNNKPSGNASNKPSGETSKPSNTAKGQQIASTGLRYVGNPYVYGGNDLENGIDCSGFTKQVHALCGIYGLPRSSGAQRGAGKAVTGGLSNALPGDVICYSGHVAIYTGNGQIVHASNPAPYPKGGIKTGSASYRPILAIRRYW